MLASSSAPAAASETFGSNLAATPETAPATCAQVCTLVASSFLSGNVNTDPALTTGVLVQVRVKSAGGGSATFRLADVIGNPAEGSGQGTGPLLSLTGGVQTFPTRMRVEAGDHLALDTTSTTALKLARRASGRRGP